jgi:hypothetical protein
LHVAERIDPIRNHETLEQLIDAFGHRAYRIGILRSPEDWYLGMAVSAVQSHPTWIAPYLQAVGIRAWDGNGTSWPMWSRTCPWSQLIASMVEPQRFEVKGFVGGEPDCHIMRPVTGRSLYASNVDKTFKVHGHVAVTQVFRMDRLTGGLHWLLKQLGVEYESVEPIFYREDTWQITKAFAYRDPSVIQRMRDVGDHAEFDALLPLVVPR